MVIVLIFVVIAGAIAGAFVFLNQEGVSGPVMPSNTVIGGTAQQSALPHGLSGTPEVVFSVSACGADLFT